MRKALTLFLFTVMFINTCVATASTPFKCLYVVAEVVPAGAGKVYLDVTDAETGKYVLDMNEDFGETGFLKAVFAEDNTEGASQGVNANKPIYECMVYVEPNDTHELVCYANRAFDHGHYPYANCYSVIRGERTRTYSFDYSGEGDRININNTKHKTEGNSSDGPSREVLCDEQYFSDEPDTHLYVILRRKGFEYPKVVRDLTGVDRVVMDREEEDALYNLAGQRVGENATGIVIRSGKKVLVRRN